MAALLPFFCFLLAIPGAVLGYLLAGWWQARRAGRHPAARQRVMVQLASGQAVAGILLSAGRLLELADPVIHDEGQAARADGRVIIEAGRVSWVQVLPPREG